MKKLKINKILLILFSCFYLLSCGYQPILNKENQKFSIKEFELKGNKRLSGLLRNNLITTKKESNNLKLIIKSDKKTSISNKSETGKILQYSVNVNFEITVEEYEGSEIIISKIYSRQKNYSASSIYLDTLNNEKKVVESMIDSIATEILVELNSIYKEK